MTGITRNGTSQATFTYDGDGNRRSKTSSSGTTTYRNDASGLSNVLQATTGSTVVSYVSGIGQYDSSKPTEVERWGYTLSDAQNARILVDGAGNLAHRWEWEPFGRPRADAGTTPAVFGFGGEQRDDESGLINLRARYYDPGIGRFLSRDSLPGSMTNGQSWNRFSYVENDPINATDPSGHKKESHKINWPMGMDPDDDADRAAKKARACRNPGQYTGSCKGGPPNAAYAADGLAGDAAKKAGQAFAAGNLAAGMAYLQSTAHFQSIAGTAAAETAYLQAYASMLAAVQSIQGTKSLDNSTPTQLNVGGDPMYRVALAGPCGSWWQKIPCAIGVGAELGAGAIEIVQRYVDGCQLDPTGLLCGGGSGAGGDEGVEQDSCKCGRGTITVLPGATPTPREWRTLNHLADQGFDIEVQKPEGTQDAQTGRTADIRIEGEAWEIYAPNSNSVEGIINNGARKGKQAPRIVVDLSETTVTERQLRDAGIVQRWQGSRYPITQIYWVDLK